ncbi:hypothetical protein ABW19_dt0205447 [Dactylella cylindrospora]|nr:hypothetical protein ABW19_dt0205447 [Dactylella cylindrospora]
MGSGPTSDLSRMDPSKDMSYLKDSSPAMVRRLRSSFLAFCLLTLSISTFLFWEYGASIPNVFHGIGDDGVSTPGSAASTGTQQNDNSNTPAPTTSTSTTGAGLDETGSTNLPYFDLAWWLRSIGRVPGDPVIFMIATNADMAVAFNMHETLGKYKRDDNFIVMCLEKACLQAPEIYTFDVAGMNKNSVKIAASIQLLHEGFNFLFVDPDVYLTGTLDPFSKMANMEQTSWDIQFFPGARHGVKGLDSSFYWARPTKYAIEFFKRVKKNWTEAGDQDLNSLMNIVGFEMYSGDGTLKLKVLLPEPFKDWEDYLDWEPENFNNLAAIKKMQNQTAAIHMTCVEPSLRTYMARNLGAWYDVESYYTGKRKFLGVKGLEGDVAHASKIVGFAAKVAMDTRRTLIFPSNVILTQARKNAATGAADYVKVPVFPAYRLVDPSSLDKLNLHMVESMYLHNRARFTTVEPSQEIIIMGNGHSAKDPLDGRPVVVKTINDMPNTDVVWLDMGSGRWWDLDASGAMAEYTKDVLTALRTCQNANEETFECNKRCT